MAGRIVTDTLERNDRWLHCAVANAVRRRFGGGAMRPGTVGTLRQHGDTAPHALWVLSSIGAL